MKKKRFSACRARDCHL